MSNKNKNRNRPQVEQKLPEDKPFVFHSKTGSVIRIPRDVVFDPDADAALAIAEAEESGTVCRLRRRCCACCVPVSPRILQTR